MQKIKRIVIDNVPVGMYLVSFRAIYGIQCNPGEHDDCLNHECIYNEPSFIEDIEPEIIKVLKSNYLILSEDVINKDETLNSDILNSDDTHDLRSRLFKTKKDAENHIKYTVDRFKKPQPWEVFVKQ